MDIYYPKDSAVSHGKVSPPGGRPGWAEGVGRERARLRSGRASELGRPSRTDRRIDAEPPMSNPISLHACLRRSMSCWTRRCVPKRLNDLTWGAGGSAAWGFICLLTPPACPLNHFHLQALKRGEPLTEESIRWLLELHGEMYLIEQHYSTRTRLRRLALNGTPVAVSEDTHVHVCLSIVCSASLLNALWGAHLPPRCRAPPCSSRSSRTWSRW